MKTMRRCCWMLTAGLVLAGGCQTWNPEAGLTLPSPRYLKHYPQYIPPSPPDPLQRERASLEEAAQPAAGPRAAP